MKKKYPPMRCCKCNHPLQRAVALKDGQPVGPVCAVAAGLVAPKAAKPVQQELAFVDTDTLDLFPPSDQ